MLQKLVHSHGDCVAVVDSSVFHTEFCIRVMVEFTVVCSQLHHITACITERASDRR